MPTKRSRRGHGPGLTDELIAVLGVGTGINHIAHDELRALWREHGAAMIALWARTYGDGSEPFVGWLAREEGWAQETDLKGKP